MEGRLVPFLESLAAVLKRAPHLAPQVLKSQILEALMEELELPAAAAAVPGSGADEPSGSEQLAEPAAWPSKKLPGRRLNGRGLPFQVSYLMNAPVTEPPACLLKARPRASLGYADQRRAWSDVLRKCGDELASVQEWVQAEMAAREGALPGLGLAQLRRGRGQLPPQPPSPQEPRHQEPAPAEQGCAAFGLQLSSRPASQLPRLPPAQASLRLASTAWSLAPAVAPLRLVSTAWGHPGLPQNGHARRFDCQLCLDEGSLEGADPCCGHHGGHPDRLAAVAQHPGMQIALAVLQQALQSQGGPAPLQVLFLFCSSGRGASISVAILLGELLQKLGYAVHVQHCCLHDGDTHERVCESCRACRPRPETLSRLLEVWMAREGGGRESQCVPGG